MHLMKGGEAGEKDQGQEDRDPQGRPDEIGRSHDRQADPLQVVTAAGTSRPGWG